MPHAVPSARQSTEWIEKIRAGDESAFEQLYRAFAPGLIAFGTRYVRERALAEELVQELFLTVWRRRAEITITGSVPTYLFTAIRNLALDRIRSERRVVQWDEAVVGRIDESAPAEDVLLDMLDLQVAVRRLPARCGLIFTLSRQHDMTYDQIAQSLGLSVKTVEVQMSRALSRLRDWLRRS